MATYITIQIVETHLIRVSFNDLQGHADVNGYDATWRRADLKRVFHNKSPEYISITMADKEKWLLNFDGTNGAYPITSIDYGTGVQTVGVDILTIHDLHLALEKLMDG